MRADEKAALAARLARALAWRELPPSDRDAFRTRAAGIVDELEAEDLETRSIGWLWVIADGEAEETEAEP